MSDFEEPPVELVEEDTTHAKILEPTPPDVQEELPTPDIKPQINITPVSTASANTSQPTNGQSFVVMQQPIQPASAIEIQQQDTRAKPEPRRGLMDLLPANDQPTQAPTPPLASPVPRAEVQQAVVIDEEKVAQYRNILRGKITAVSSAQRVAEILKWLEKESIQADPAALKAVYLLAHEEASVAKNIQEVQRIQKMIESHRHLFPEAEQIEMRKRFFIDCTKSQELKKPERASDRQVVTSELLALFDQIVDRDPESADTVLKAAKTAIGMQRDASVKADFAKKFADAESRLKEAKAYAVERAKEAEELRLALVTLQENPHEPNALKVVAMVRLSEGKIKEALDFLSRSNSPKSGVAKDTLFMLNSPVLARGTLAAALAHEWIDLSSKLKNGKKNSANRIAARLLTIAIGAKQDPLNPIDKETEMEVLAKLSASLKGQPIDASDVAQSSWKDVTRDIDLTKAKGEWYREANGAIVMKPGINSRIILPVTVPQFGDFEASIRCKVTRTKGNNAIQVTIPLGNGTTLVVNGWPEKGGVSGLSLIDGNEADANESCVKGLAIGDSKPKLVEVSVKRKGSTGSVHLTIDGKPSVNWSGELSRLSNHPLHRINDPQAFALGGYETQVEFSNIEMTLVTGAPAQPQAGAIRQASVERVSPQENRPAVEPNRPKNVPKEAAWNPELKGWVLAMRQEISMMEALQIAKMNKASLVVARSQAENDSIRILAREGKMFLGFVKGPDGKLVCMDGSKAPYENWGNGEGTNFSEKIVLMDTDGTWQDYPDSATARPCFLWKAN